MTSTHSFLTEGGLLRLSEKTAISFTTLKDLLPDVETALFFGKVYDLSTEGVTYLLQELFKTPLLKALDGQHSTELQSYVVGLDVPDAHKKKAKYGHVPAPQGVLPEMWAQMEITIAGSIREVAEKLKDTLEHLPSKEGKMVFRNLALLNRQRPTIGDYVARIKHTPITDNLLIFDTSGSMTSTTVEAISQEVVDLAYSSNSTLAIVSNTTQYWGPGEATVAAVLKAAQYGGTRYETLASLLNQRNWANVITIADYDSSGSAKEYLAKKVTTRAQRVIDISLVNVPTFLSECVGQFADKIQPILIGNSYRVLH